MENCEIMEKEMRAHQSDKLSGSVVGRRRKHKIEYLEIKLIECFRGVEFKFKFIGAYINMQIVNLFLLN